MQEGDVQIKGYPVRLPLDVLMMFTANPEDYTARGKIITPLKDRIGSEIRTHYPAAIEIGMKITAQEAWTRRDDVEVQVPDYLLEVIEGIAFAAREDSRIDKRSGVSQRLPITCLENVISNVERRAATRGDGASRARMSDVYAALPAVTGKIELEYEGELKGAETVAREIVRSAVARAFDRRVDEAGSAPIVDWFEQGGLLRLDEDGSDSERLSALAGVPPLEELDRAVVGAKHDPGAVATAAEFVLEGLYGKRRISRSDERLYMKAEPVLEPGAYGAGSKHLRFDDDLMQ